MPDVYKEFLKDSRRKAFDLIHREKIKFNISRYDNAVALGKQQYQNMELAKKRANILKRKSIQNLDKYLVEFEAAFTRRGGKVIWAADEKEATKEIVKILKKHEVKLVVKSKSMVTEEIELNHVLEKNKIRSVETDLGEYIVQIAGERPYHIVTPAMHKSKEDIAELFHKLQGTPPDSTPEFLTNHVRHVLRKEFVEAGAGITGANFLIADTGSVALTENEGNGLLSMAWPKIHIAITGIEKIIPSINDLALFWPLLSTHGTGQHMTVYNSIINGPRKEKESDGPEEMYVVLLDNGRSKILEQIEQRQALWCIRCGACLNGCPVYKNIGGHSYGTTYSGPIGSVITPFFKGFREYNHLSFASSLCGKCTDVCPVKIPLHELLLLNRNESVKQKVTSAKWRMIAFGSKQVFLHRWMMNFGSSGMKNMFMRTFVKGMWGSNRNVPVIAKKNFNQMWKEKHPKN